MSNSHIYVSKAPAAGTPSCPRCDGFMHHDRDWYGSYVECLYCGYMLDTGDESWPKEAPLEAAASGLID